jgi:hypothetical protein
MTGVESLFPSLFEYILPLFLHRSIAFLLQ